MSTTPVITEAPLTTITQPDTSSLPAVSFEPMLSLKVVDEDTCTQARNNTVVANDYLSKLEAIFDKPTKAANALHKWFTTSRAKMAAPAEAIKEHNKTEIGKFLKAQEEQRRVLAAKLQAEANKRAQEEAERERAERLANAMPWEMEEAVGRIIDTVMAAPTITLAAAPFVDGIGTRNKPWTYEVFDLVALLKAAIAKPELLAAIQVNDQYLKIMAKDKKQDLEKYFPGVRGKREQAVTVK